MPFKLKPILSTIVIISISLNGFIVVFFLLNWLAFKDLSLEKLAWSNFVSYRLRFARPNIRDEQRGVYTDSQGFRKPSWHSSHWTAQDSGQMKIGVFGGSTTYSLGVKDDETFPAQLEVELKKLGTRAFVTNFGSPGYALKQEAYVLVDALIEGYRPSLVIFYDGINELNQFKLAVDLGQQLTYAEVDYGYERIQTILNRKINTLQQFHVDSVPLLKWLSIRHENEEEPLHYIDESLLPPVRIGSTRLIDDEYIQYYAREHARAYIKKVEFLAFLSKTYGFKLVMAQQPFATFLEPEQSCLTEGKSVINKNAPQSRYYMSLYDELHRQLKLRKNLQHWDMRGLFSGRSCAEGPILLEEYHLNAMGNRILAKEVAQQIQNI